MSIEKEAFRNKALGILADLYCKQNGMKLKSAEVILPDGRREIIRGSTK